MSKIINKKKQKEVVKWLTILQSANCCFASIERVLELPQKTFKSWIENNGKILPEEYALLKIIMHFPWTVAAFEDFKDITRYRSRFKT